MHQFHRPELSIKYLDDGIRILVFRAQSGETIGCEVNEETAAEWASLIVAPRPGEVAETDRTATGV
jgi:hypothetical protein